MYSQHTYFVIILYSLPTDVVLTAYSFCTRLVLADDERIQGGDGLTLKKREVLTLILYTQTWQQK